MNNKDITPPTHPTPLYSFICTVSWFRSVISRHPDRGASRHLNRSADIRIFTGILPGASGAVQAVDHFHPGDKYIIIRL